jgi:hypothetical protein
MDPVVILSATSVAAAPGGEARLPVRIRNQGRRVESYRVEVVGTPAAFTTVEPASASVLPGKEAEVVITFRPPVGAQTPTGTLPFGVRAVSEVGSSASAVAEGNLDIAGVAGLSAWADTTTASGRWSGKFRLSFSNQGNAPVRLAVTAHDPAAALKLSVHDDVVNVLPGAQQQVTIRAKARQPFLRGSPTNRTITAACQDFAFGAERPIPGQAPPKDDPHHRTFQLNFQQKPVLSKGLVLAAGLVLALVVALVVLQFRGGSDEVALGLAIPEAPTTFTAEAVDSTTIALRWTAVPNATGYDIRRTTEAGEASGPAIDTVEAGTTTYTVDGLGPEEPHCFAVQAKGPEGVGNSQLSDTQCATTAAAPQLLAPLNFVATPVSGPTVDLRWEYPEADLSGITFSVFVNNEPVAEGIAGLFTTIDVTQRDVTSEATLFVKAARDDLVSDASNAQVVTIPALGSATTTIPGGSETPTVPGGGSGGPTTTTAQTAPTTTTGSTTTTTPTPAQGELQDLAPTWAAVLGALVPPPAGVGEDAQRARLAEQFNAEPGQILTFSNRDTLVTDAGGAAVPTFADASPAETFFYIAANDEPTAQFICANDVRCHAVHLSGAPRASEGLPVLVIERLDRAAALADVDARIGEARDGLDDQAVHVLDGATRSQFDANQLVVFADGFTTEQAVTDFCVAHGLPRCETVVIRPG